MDVKTYQKKFKKEDAVGWLSIDKQIEKIYGKQQPRHYAPVLHHILGGPDPIDGISYYDSNQQVFHRHIVSYGMSELYYNESKAGGPFSKWGFEFTFRIKPVDGDTGDPLWVGALMNNLARYVFESGKWFEPYHFIPANGPIRLDTDTDITGIAFIEDPELGKIDTPHGEMTFLQMVGITQKELDNLWLNPKKSEVEKLLKKLQKDNPLLITDLTRK
jgi:Suppressor of fused protein (SUFU)